MANRNEATKEQAREILKNGILNMSVEKLVQMTQYGLCGNISTFGGLYATTHYFNRMNMIEPENDEDQDIIEYSFGHEDDVIAATSFCITEIEDISGSINEDHPEDMLVINITMSDGTEIVINIIY